MKSELLEIHKEAMALIEQFAKRGDASRISRVASIANNIQQLQMQLVHVEQEIPRIKESLAGYKANREDQAATDSSKSTDPHASGHDGDEGEKKLRIQMDWSRLGKPGGKENISENTSSDTMTKWAVRLYQQFGVQILQKLAAFRIGRRPLISNRPQEDFFNKKKGTPYSNQPILDSGYYILTHSDTHTKINYISRACKFLGFHVGAVIVDEIVKETIWSGF